MVDDALANSWVWVIGIAAVVGVVLMALRTSGLRRLRWRWRLERVLRRGSTGVYRGLDLPDGLEGRTRLDYLLLLPSGLVLLELRLYPGAVFGAQDVDQWTQMLRGRSFHFANPIRELETKLAAVRLRVGDAIPLRGFLLFSDETEFPKGRPECVVRLADLSDVLPVGSRGQVDTDLDQAWRSLAPGGVRGSDA